MAPLGSSQPFVSRQQVVLVLALISGQRTHHVTQMQIATTWTSANRRSIFPGHRFQTATSPAKMPRRSYRVFLLQEIIFAHCPYDNLYFNQPRLRGNLLCRAEWLCLRGIASCECAIFSFREIASQLTMQRLRTNQLRGAAPPKARRSLWAPESVNKCCWQPSQSRQDNQPEKKRRIRRRHCAIPAEVLIRRISCAALW